MFGWRRRRRSLDTDSVGVPCCPGDRPGRSRGYADTPCDLADHPYRNAEKDAGASLFTVLDVQNYATGVDETVFAADSEIVDRHLVRSYSLRWSKSLHLSNNRMTCGKFDLNNDEQPMEVSA